MFNVFKSSKRIHIFSLRRTGKQNIHRRWPIAFMCWKCCDSGGDDWRPGAVWLISRFHLKDLLESLRLSVHAAWSFRRLFDPCLLRLYMTRVGPERDAEAFHTIAPVSQRAIWQCWSAGVVLRQTRSRWWQSLSNCLPQATRCLILQSLLNPFWTPPHRECCLQSLLQNSPLISGLKTILKTIYALILHVDATGLRADDKSVAHPLESLFSLWHDSSLEQLISCAC